MGVRGAYRYMDFWHTVYQPRSGLVFSPAAAITCIFVCVYFLVLVGTKCLLHSLLDLCFKNRTAHATTGSDFLYKPLHSIQIEYILYIHTNAHTDCTQLKIRASVFVYCDFVCQVKESENSIFMAQRVRAHWHLSRAEQTELHGPHCKAFLPAQASFSVVSFKLHWLFEVQMLDLHLQPRYGINHSVTGRDKYSFFKRCWKLPWGEWKGKLTNSLWHQFESTRFLPMPITFPLELSKECSTYTVEKH